MKNIRIIPAIVRALVMTSLAVTVININIRSEKQFQPITSTVRSSIEQYVPLTISPNEITVLTEEDQYIDQEEPEEQYEYSGTVLCAYHGVNYNSFGNKETYYNLDMSGVVYYARVHGYSEEEYPYYIRDDGVKMLGQYVMVAANLDIYPRYTVVSTSLGLGLVCDTGSFAQDNPYQFDIATSW